MRKKVKISLFFTLSAFAIVGCSNNNNLSVENCGEGNYCYKNINFGPTQGSEYEKGIRDGCTTGEGDFRKDYSLSSSSKSYFDGWILGRSKCKQILPNEGTKQEELNSKKRAEYQIEQMKLQQGSSTSDSEEGVVDSLLNNKKDTTAQDVEY